VGSIPITRSNSARGWTGVSHRQRDRLLSAAGAVLRRGFR